jgi:putative hydrolase of the HAD superfamily
MVLILDLDDTIYETATIGHEIIRNGLQDLSFDSNLIDSLMKDFGVLSTVNIFKKHKITSHQIEDFYQSLVHQKANLTIQPFEDYAYLKGLPFEKYLVTTGYTEWQLAKIEHLGIAMDFKEVMIHVPGHRHNKKHFFKKIQQTTGLSFDQHYVIGDNPSNELKHGHDLGMKTIQRTNSKQPIFPNADFHIESFKELQGILQQQQAKARNFG